MLIRERTDTMIFVGIDVASKKHDCFLMQDETGILTDYHNFLTPTESRPKQKRNFYGCAFLLYVTKMVMMPKTVGEIMYK